MADNLLNQEFKPSKPNEVWVSDITYIQTDEGWLYLAGIKDVFTCEIVGYARTRMTQELVSQALWKAVKWKRPEAGLILHSIGAASIARTAIASWVDQFKSQASMSRRGNCYDNAPMESFCAA